MQYLGLVKNFVSEVLMQNQVPDSVSFFINLCINECVNNAIIHGNRQDPNKFVLVSFFSDSGFLIFEIADEGEGFNYSDLPDPTSFDNIKKEGGRGLYIIQSLVDEIIFKNNGSLVQLKFKL